MKKKSLFLLFAMMLVLSAFLAACNKDGGDKKPKKIDKEDRKKEEVVKEDPVEMTVHKKAVRLFTVSTLNQKVNTALHFTRISTDAEVLEFFDEAFHHI